MPKRLKTADFFMKPGERIAVIAGGGMLPIQIAATLKARGQDAVMILIRGEAASEDHYAGFPCEWLSLEEFGWLIAKLRGHNVTHAVLAGNVRRRPKLSALRWDLSLLRPIFAVVPALRKGDDALLKAIVRYAEKAGVTIVGVQDVMPDLLVIEGVLTRRRPGKRDRADVNAAMVAARAIGALDIGQAAIAIGGRTVSLEGVEGTDQLLKRTASLRGHGRLAAAKGGVLAKCSKPGQELRVDLPSIGPKTVTAAAKAGLSGIVLEAGNTIILEQKRTIELANEHSLFILGMKPEPK